MVGVEDDGVMLFGHEGEPGQKPKQAEKTESNEKGTPAEPVHENTTEEHAEAGTEDEPGGHGRIGEAPAFCRIVERNDFGVGKRKGDGFAHTENKAQQESAAKV